MAYLASIHKPSSVRHALTLKFFNEDEECLVVAKANILEFYQWSESSISLHYSTAIYGQITMLEKLHPLSAETDHLFVGIDQHTYFTVSWNPQTRELQTEKACVDVGERAARDTQTGEKCVADPERRCLVLEMFEGILMVVPIVKKPRSRKRADELGDIADHVIVRVPELFIRSMAFLHGTPKPRLAVLWEDAHTKVHLTLKTVAITAPGPADASKAELTDEPVLADIQDPGAAHVIPVPEPAGGVIVVGESAVYYVDAQDELVASVSLPEPASFVAWTGISATEFLLGDEGGKLQLLTLASEGNDPSAARQPSFVHLGAVSRPICLVRLPNDCVFVGSHQGDSQVIRLDLPNSTIETLQTLPNIAPILDFTIMDLGSRAGDAQMNEYSSGQARIVTGSGAFQDGSLRSVRSSVGLEEQGTLAEISGIRGLYSLRTAGGSEFDDTLVVSLLDESRIFSFSPEGEVEELESFGGFSQTEHTLTACNVVGHRILQVTSSQVQLIDAEGTTTVAQWKPDAGKFITSAAANAEKVLLAVAGMRLVVLDVRSDLAVVADAPGDESKQIACVTLPAAASDIGVIGIWQDATVAVLRLDTLEVVHAARLSEQGEASVPRSLLLAPVLAGHARMLLVAMADGTVLTFTLDAASSALSGKKSIVLGTQEAKFWALARGNGLYNVFATCEHPSLIYGSEGRLVYSAVTAEEATAVCQFNAEAFPGSVVVSTSEELKLAVIDEERRTHVRDLHIGETVRRVAYAPPLKAFGLGTISRRFESGAEVVRSHVKLVEEIIFDLLDTYDLNADELVESVIRAELRDSANEPVERFIVGTGYIEEAVESMKGRIIIFEVDKDRKLQVVTELGVKGACRCLGVLDGKIVAALIKTVVVYSLDYEDRRAKLTKRATYRTSTAPIDLAITGNQIAVTDLMKSLSIVEYKAGEDGLPDTLDEVARHFGGVWGTAVGHVAEDTFLQSDAEGNLMVLHRNRNGVTPEDQRRLEVTSEMRLGEMVNRIRILNVPVSSDAVVIPRAFLATIHGAIYLFALISPKQRDLLMKLQARMAERVEAVGRLSFNAFRASRIAVREADEPYRFVDGDLIERFADYGDAVQQDIVDGLGVDVESVRNMVEGLKRLR